MKKSSRLILYLAGISLCIGSNSVGRADAGHGIPKVMQKNDDPNVGIKYKKNQGLYVTDISARVIGLQMAEVEETPLPRRLEFTAQVYDTAPVGKALATAWLPASQAELLTGGTEVVVGQSGRGVITAVSQLTASVNQQAEVLVELSDPNETLSIGQFVDASIALAPTAGAVVIPKSAVLKTSEGRFAYADNSGWKVRTPIKTGTEHESYVEVTEGLLAGDSVVTHPVMTLWMTELQLTKSGKA